MDFWSTAIAVCINNTFAGILGLTFPRLLTAFGKTGACKFKTESLSEAAYVARLVPV